MAKIRNSSMDNWYGNGKQQIFTDDNGDEYTIRNSSMDNWYGDGKQQIVTKRGKNVQLPSANSIFLWISIIAFMIAGGSLIFTLHINPIILIIAFVSMIIDVILGFFKV